jgi:hypothetical protein
VSFIFSLAPANVAKANVLLNGWFTQPSVPNVTQVRMTGPCRRMERGCGLGADGGGAEQLLLHLARMHIPAENPYPDERSGLAGGFPG